jgi:hypothetical protein
MGKNGELTPRQKKMIAALMTSENIGKACESAKIGRSTLARWLKDPTFNQELEKAESEAIKQASRELLSGQTEALATIREIMQSRASDSIRLRAANDWMNLLFKIREMATLEERITKLEERIK